MLEFFNKINNILLVLFVLMVVLAVYSVTHDAFLQRLLDLVTGGFLTLAVGKTISAANANTLENSNIETANVTVTPSPEQTAGAA